MILSIIKTFLFYYLMNNLLKVISAYDNHRRNKDINKDVMDISSSSSSNKDYELVLKIMISTIFSIIIIDFLFVKLIGWYQFTWTSFFIKLFLVLFFMHRLNLYPPSSRSLKLTLLTLNFYCIHLFFS